MPILKDNPIPHSLNIGLRDIQNEDLRLTSPRYELILGFDFVDKQVLWTLYNSEQSQYYKKPLLLNKLQAHLQ